jgi:hypothetical protein
MRAATSVACVVAMSLGLILDSRALPPHVLFSMCATAVTLAASVQLHLIALPVTTTLMVLLPALTVLLPGLSSRSRCEAILCWFGMLLGMLLALPGIAFAAPAALSSFEDMVLAMGLGMALGVCVTSGLRGLALVWWPR